MKIIYLIATFLMLDIMVILHEGGHYLFARVFHIGVLEYSIGMGPVLASKTSKKTGIKYSLRAFPIGGYVSMEGENGISDRPDAFCNRPVLHRIITVLAGPAVNVLLGFLCMLILVSVSPTPVSNKIYDFIEDNPVSCEYGLKAGDTVIKVGKTRVRTGNELVYEIMMQGNEPVDLTVIREGETILLPDVLFPVEEENGVMIGSYDFIMYSAEKNFANVISHSFFRSCSSVKMIWDSIIGMITGRFGLDSVSGPIGISETVGQALASSFPQVLYLFIIITINLGVMNLLPLPALDGGRLLLLIIEAVTRKRVPSKVENFINAAGFFLLMLLTVLITAKDLLNWIG